LPPGWLSRFFRLRFKRAMHLLIMKHAIIVLSVMMSCSWVLADEQADLRQEVDSLKRQMTELRSRVQALENQKAQPAIDRKAGIRQRYEQDRKTYNEDQLHEIEALYQSANKDLRNPEAKAALQSLIEKFPKANRTGCAVQYVGQMSSGEEKERYLKLAIKEFGDCFYGDGVQVGAYARYCLVCYYKETGKEQEAKALFEELRKNYPEAITHQGQRLGDLLPR
jgi:hypothetical protein